MFTFLKTFTYLLKQQNFRDGGRKREKGERDTSTSTGFLPKWPQWLRVRLNPGAWDSILVSHMDCYSLGNLDHHLLPSQARQQGTGLEVRKAKLKLVFKWMLVPQVVFTPAIPHPQSNIYNILCANKIFLNYKTKISCLSGICMWLSSANFLYVSFQPVQ